MNKRDFAADRAICDAAQAGNWFVLHKVDIEVERPEGSGYTDPIGSAYSMYDAEFIAEARQGWPAALDEIARLRAEVELLREMKRQLIAANDANYARACEYAGEIERLQRAYAADIAAEIEREVDNLCKR